jgi:sn-glycerol 3-phosphate transport system permease protein
MEKRVTFKGWLAAAGAGPPQVFISASSFSIPAAQAIWQSLFIPDPFGLSMQFVGLGQLRVPVV